MEYSKFSNAHGYFQKEFTNSTGPYGTDTQIWLILYICSTHMDNPMDTAEMLGMVIKGRPRFKSWGHADEPVVHLLSKYLFKNK